MWVLGSDRHGFEFQLLTAWVQDFSPSHLVTQSSMALWGKLPTLYAYCKCLKKFM